MVREYYSLKELAFELCVNPRTIQKWRDEGRFPEPEICEPRFVRWTRKQFEDWGESRKRKEAAA